MTTRTQTTQPASDSTADDSPRRFAWLFEHGWLIAGGLLVLALVPAEADKAESATMRQNRDRIAAMSRSERQRVEFNFAEYRKLTPQQRREVNSLHADVENDPGLAATLTAWHQWLGSLNFEDRDNILQTTDPAARLALVRELLNATAPADDNKAEPQYRPNNFASNRSLRLPHTATEFNALMRALARHLNIPDHPRENTPQGRMIYHASIVEEVLVRIRRPNGQGETSPRPFDRIRMSFSPELRRKLIDALPDPARRRTITQQGEVEQQRSLAQIIISGFYRELQIVMEQLKPDDDMLLALYLDLPQKQKDGLDQLPQEQFTRRLDELWLERQFPELARHVQEIRRLLPSRTNQRPGFLQNSNRPFLPGGRRNVDTPGNRDE